MCPKTFHLRSRRPSLAKAVAVRNRELDGIAEFALLEFLIDDRDQVVPLSRPYDLVTRNDSDNLAACLSD